MAQRVRKITPEVLKQIIVQEARKLQAESYYFDKKHPEEVEPEELKDAGDYAHHLENPVDHYKQLKIKEARLLKQLQQIQEKKQQVRRKMGSK